jgi:hypothetical protein
MWGEILGAVLGGVNVGLQVFGAASGASATEKQAEQQAESITATAESNRRISLYDAAAAEEEADAVRESVGREIALFARKGNALLAAQKTLYAKSGVATGTGTPLQTMSRTGLEMAKTADLIRYEGETTAKRAESLAQRYRLLAAAGMRDAAAQAALVTGAAQDRSQAYWIQGASNILSSSIDLWSAFK